MKFPACCDELLVRYLNVKQLQTQLFELDNSKIFDKTNRLGKAKLGQIIFSYVRLSVRLELRRLDGAPIIHRSRLDGYSWYVRLELKRPILALSNKIKVIVELTIVEHPACFGLDIPYLSLTRKCEIVTSSTTIARLD